LTEYNKTQPRNRLLSKLPTEDLRTLMSRMELVELDIRDPAYEANEHIEFCFFPESGVISIVAPLNDGWEVEVATVGNEGMVGVPLVLHARSTPTKAYCQIPGWAWRIAADDFRNFLSSNTHFSVVMHRYAQMLFDSVAQTSACNRLHTIEQRCARWLLLLHDRAENSDAFLLTQEFLAQMLGVRRTGVNLAAGALQKANLITYRRGKITILNRAGLEAISCECYCIVHRAFQALEAEISV
jgi:CRP-like cAMP-binding protein